MNTIPYDVQNIAFHAPGYFFSKSIDGSYLWANRNWLEFLGVDALSLVIGKTDQDFFSKEEAEKLRANDKRILHAEKTLTFEEKVTQKNGKKKNLIVTGSLLRDEKNNVVGVTSTAIDVIQKNDSDVEKDEDYNDILCVLDHILSSMPSAIYWKDKCGNYLGISDSAIRNTGFKSKSEIIGKNDVQLFGKKRGALVRKNDMEVLKKEMSMELEETIVMPNGESHTFLVLKTPLKNKKGIVSGILGISIDITDKKKTEILERENALNAMRVETEILERENALNAMRVETINRFCRKLLHDIRSPLSTLRMLITVLCKATLEGDATIDLVRIRGTAYRCIRRIEAMANSLLRQYRQQESGENLQIEPTLLMPLVVDALLEKRSTLSMEDIKLKQEMQGAHSLSSTVECFELVQIFSNLINNCAEAIVEKREKIGDKKAEGLVRFKMTEQKEHVHFAISDNGCGIPQNLLEDIFLKDKTTKKEGSGIGLFHAREGIDSWGGKIWAESEDGKGATMNILLPKSPVPPSWFATQIEVPKNGFLVVVDDEPHLYYSIKKCVQEQSLSEDIQLVEIKTLSEFDEWYEEHKEENPVILMDYLFYNEQKKTGLDAIKENDLKNAILVTNIYDDVFLRKECTDMGVQLIPKNIIDRIPILLK